MFSINKKSSMVSMIVENIIDNINKGNLTAGDDLPTEMELAESFEVSRNTVREALRVLETYGVVETSRRKPPKVVNKNLQASIAIAAIQVSENKNYYREIQQIRELMGVGLVDEILKNASDEDIAALQTINDQIEHTNTVAHLAELDFSFHTRLVEISGNSMVKAIYSSLASTIVHILEIGKNLEVGIEQAREGHQEIIEALREGDNDHTRKIISSHFQYTRHILEE
ncbi:FCD domain-containing protein [Photobacterium sp. ZSDE20]|uniref:FCD domain-containing protein n=1 Tax=Photobacterium pectinilyticum TaxID=2906793 RepID=A0ABT1N952_9GAMM|nr:FCD domain-containing protein [Photobacterium sp. ZSDE20]MCQ1061267.1 FCD domain-containing protein [Photobacterium sp. ZSDE20]MDD1829761.1 FCD domain-containing protein [Photobacterium sp. ZSDE20]